ncbi:hypothetical protein KSS87_023891, partial [Heliosperma pusillum]
MKQGRLIVHTRSYKLFTQEVTIQPIGNEARKTHCSHKELHCKQWVKKQARVSLF